MNLNTLEDYLYELNMLVRVDVDFPTKAEDLRTKIIDALKELKLYDADSIPLGFLKFKKQFVHQENPYRDSINKMRSHLESKIEVQKHRIALFKRQQQRDLGNRTIRENEQINSLSQHVKQLESTLKEKEGDIKANKIVIDDLRAQIEQLKQNLRKKRLIHGLWSMGVWGVILTVFIGLLGVVYNVGKDNATKEDDVEKAELRSKNKILTDSLSIQYLKNDSLKKLLH